MIWRKDKRKYHAQLAVLRDHEEELHQFVQAILANEPDVEQRLAVSLSSKPEHVRWAFINQLRERVHDEKEQLANQIEPMLQRREQEIIADRKERVKKWLAFMLPTFNQMRSSRAYFLHTINSQKMDELRKELREEGICDAMDMNLKELGHISADPHMADQPGRHKDHEHDL